MMTPELVRSEILVGHISVAHTNHTFRRDWEDGIDLDKAAWITEKANEYDRCHQQLVEYDPDPAVREAPEDFAQHIEAATQDYYRERPVSENKYLVGHWKDGQPDRTKVYSAICQNGVVQVVWSKYVAVCDGEGDLEASDTTHIAYSLPPYFMRSYWEKRKGWRQIPLEGWREVQTFYNCKPAPEDDVYMEHLRTAAAAASREQLQVLGKAYPEMAEAFLLLRTLVHMKPLGGKKR